LAEAHQLGVVHRDLKPANLYLTTHVDGMPLVKVLDFGIAKAVADALPGVSPNLTVTGVALGTPCYMSPEQVRNAKQVDPRTDVWGLGTVLYHLLTGKPPFYDETLPAVCARIIADPPQPVRESRSDVPAGLEQVIERCLEKDRSNRYADLSELAGALAPFAPERAQASVQRIARIVNGSGGRPSAVGRGDEPDDAASAETIRQSPSKAPPARGDDDAAAERAVAADKHAADASDMQAAEQVLAVRSHSLRWLRRSSAVVAIAAVAVGGALLLSSVFGAGTQAAPPGPSGTIAQSTTAKAEPLRSAPEPSATNAVVLVPAHSSEPGPGDSERSSSSAAASSHRSGAAPSVQAKAPKPAPSAAPAAKTSAPQGTSHDSTLRDRK